MANISDLKLTSNGASWKDGAIEIEVSSAGASQLLADSKKGLIFILINMNETNKFLNIYSISGELLASLSPPSDFSFSYLTKHPDVGIAVVAGAKEKIDGWYDWHFGFDDLKKKLFRHCPAY